MIHKLVYLLSFVIINFFSMANGFSKECSYLYPGEKIVFYNDIPALIKFNKGSKNNPLIVFIPGDANLARIAYGYPDGNKKDFLAYWFHRYGFSFLGVSYPLDNPVYKKVYPSFTIRDWGRQVMYSASLVIKNNQLSKHVIILTWSMAGIVSESLNEAAHKYGLKVDVEVSLASTPPFPKLIVNQKASIKKASNGLADRVSLRTKKFLKSIQEENKFNNHIIIPDNIYLSQFIGNTPVDIINTSIRYKHGNFHNCPLENINDSGAFEYQSYPFVVVIHGDSREDPQHALADEVSWLMLDAQMIYRQCTNLNKKTIHPNDWINLYTLVNNFPEKLVEPVSGNHFFFIGEIGARRTVEMVIKLQKKSENIQNKIKIYCGNA